MNIHLRYMVSIFALFYSNSEYENVEPNVVKRSVSFEKAIRARQAGDGQEQLTPIAEKNPSPPPIPRRKDW